MLRARNIKLCGLEMDGSRQLSPRTKRFCEEHNMKVTQSDGFVTITGAFSLKKDEVDEFLKAKAAQDVGISKEDNVAEATYAESRKGFLQQIKL